MNSTVRRLLSAASALFALTLSPFASGAQVFSDTFDYYNWDSSGSGLPAMTTVWTLQNGTAPTIVKSSTTYPNFDTPYLNVRAGVISANLGGTLAGNFQLTVNALHLVDGRSFWIGLFNADGTQGYGLRWEAYATGGGSLRLVGFDNATLSSSLAFSTDQSAPAFYVSGGPIGRPGQPANTTPDGGNAAAKFITVGLSYVAETNSLSLSIGGSVVGSVVLGEDALTGFSKIYVGASADAAIGDITVTGTAIPEPAHAGIFAAAGAALLAVVRCGGRRR